MIRKATVADLPGMKSGALEFYATSAELGTFDIDRFCGLWENLLGSDSGVIFLALRENEIKGAIGGMVYDDPYSIGQIAQEFFWFVRADSRGSGVRLFREFENWGRDKGARAIRMCHMVDSMPEKVAQFYENSGFHKIEVHYSKELVCQ